MKQFAVLQLSGCAGCEVSLLNADAWIDQYHLAYMPLVISADYVLWLTRETYTSPISSI